MSPTPPPYGAPIPLPPLVRGKVRYSLVALRVIDGKLVPRFRVTNAAGVIGEGDTPDLALGDLLGKAPPSTQAPAFLAWAVLRPSGDNGQRVVHRAYVAGFADRHGTFKVALRGRHWTPSDAEREIPRLFDAREVSLRPGLTKGERVEPRVILGETLPIYLPSAHPEGVVWADLLHDADPRVPDLIRTTDRGALRRAYVSRTPLDNLLSARSTWRPGPPSLDDIARHAARSGEGVGVWAFRDSRRGTASLFTMRVDDKVPGHYLAAYGAVYPASVNTSYEHKHLGGGWWRPLHYRSLGPVGWPSPPLAEGDEVLIVEATRYGHNAGKAVFRRFEGEGANRTAFVSQGSRGFNVLPCDLTRYPRKAPPAP